jgi:hypothetical protein
MNVFSLMEKTFISYFFIPIDIAVKSDFSDLATISNTRLLPTDSQIAVA